MYNNFVLVLQVFPFHIDYIYDCMYVFRFDRSMSLPLSSFNAGDIPYPSVIDSGTRQMISRRMDYALCKFSNDPYQSHFCIQIQFVFKPFYFIIKVCKIAGDYIFASYEKSKLIALKVFHKYFYSLGIYFFNQPNFWSLLIS